MMFFIILLLILSGVIGYYIGKEKTIGAEGGLAFGLLLGVVGVIIVACYPNKPKMPMTELEAAATSRPESSVPEQIEKWFELKEKGIITEEEFEAQKKKFLS